MAKVLLELEVSFDGSEGEPTVREVEEFTRNAIELAEECSASRTFKVKKLEVVQEEETILERILLKSPEGVMRKAAEQGTVIIPQSRYNALVESSHFLDCLKACGVDNWEGYGYAREIHEEENEEEIEEEEVQQNIVKVIDGKVHRLQFDYCERCKYFKSCYERDGTPDYVSEICMATGWKQENIAKKEE